MTITLQEDASGPNAQDCTGTDQPTDPKALLIIDHPPNARLRQPVPELGLLQLVQEPDPVRVMGNMAVVAQGLTWLQLRPPLRLPQLPKRYAAVQGVQRQPTPDEDGVEGGGGGEGEEEGGVEGGGDGGGGDLLLLQMYRHFRLT
ncbi:hypothetical protein GH733_013972 [Mirounga leonina]|nr:hypothetical protein GH733_013972 [Mirounga leonina]